MSLYRSIDHLFLFSVYVLSSSSATCLFSLRFVCICNTTIHPPINLSSYKVISYNTFWIKCFFRILCFKNPIAIDFGSAPYRLTDNIVLHFHIFFCENRKSIFSGHLLHNHGGDEPIQRPKKLDTCRRVGHSHWNGGRKSDFIGPRRQVLFTYFCFTFDASSKLSFVRFFWNEHSAIRLELQF